MNKLFVVLLFLCVFSITESVLSAPAYATPPSATGTFTRTVKIPRYEKFEALFTLPNQTGNPFDPRDNDLDAAFLDPNGRHIIVPAFWDGDRWRVRFAPSVPGRYKLAILSKGQVIHPADLSPASFTCVASANPGNVRRNVKVVQGFVLDNGSPYYPLGMDVAWAGGNDADYPMYFANMGAAHMNFARVWMTAWDGKNLEWASDRTKSPPIGTYLLDTARKWDAIFDDAEKNGVYIQMTLQHHGQYTARTDPNWADNPFNVANGGFLKNPDDFFTDPEAKRLTRAKYRYIVARYGYSTHLLSFELFNEVQNIGEANTHFGDVVSWHQEMAAYLRGIDVNHHLITTSNSDPGSPLTQIGLDYNQVHFYSADMITTLGALKPGDQTPIFVGEWGPSGNGSGNTEAFLHNGLWASLMQPTAGAAQFWYWDQVQKNNWWSEYAAATAFVHDSGLAAHPGLTALPVQVKATGPRAALSFTPPGGWEATKRYTINLAPDVQPDLSGVSSFIQGVGNRPLMTQPIVFSLTSPGSGHFTVEFGQSSRNGAHPTLAVDGGPSQALDFPATAGDNDAGKSMTVDFPAGTHQIALFNTGQDWVTVNQIVVSDFTAPVAVVSKGNTSRNYFWAYQRDPKNPATKTMLVFPNLAPGKYQIRLWDTATGKALPFAEPITQTAAQLGEIVLPAFAQDIAGVVEPQ